MLRSVYFFIQVFFSFTCAAYAQNLAEREIAKIPQILRLSKLTVGPYDNYQGEVDGRENFLIFTRKIDMVPLLFRQDLKKGEAQIFLDAATDAQEPSLSPNSGQVAFVLYKRLAHGEICWQNLALRGLNFSCLPAGEGEVSAPLWLSERRLAYLSRKVGAQEAELRAYDLDLKQEEVLYRGNIWAPSVSPDGKWLAFVRLNQEPSTATMRSSKSLALWDIQQKRLSLLNLSVAGVSGFPRFSANGEFLYFTQYSSDTNGDQIVDIHDHGVIFRLPAGKAQAIVPSNSNKVIFPEQLTSSDTNCSFPRPQKSYLYVTCGFEGSLDIYRLPLTGLVPQDWSEKRLWNAHQSSRTYGQRILLLNSLRYRFNKESDLDLIARLLSDHIYAEDIEAALFFNQILQEQVGGKNCVYPILALFLRALGELREANEGGDEPPTDELRKRISRLLASLETPALSQAEPKSRQIVKIWLESHLDDEARNLARWQRASLGGVQSWHPMTSHLYFAAAQKSLPKTKWTDEWLRVYENMIQAPGLSDESQIFYGYTFLSQLQERGLALADRLEKIEQLNLRIQNIAVKTLLAAERTVLELVRQKNATDKRKAYIELDRLMVQTKNTDQLRRALYVRAITNLAEFDEAEYLNAIAANWLKFTHKEDTEFYYARDHFAEVVTSRAYFHILKQQKILASSLFYNGLTLADDFESHYGYITSKLALGELESLLRSYEHLQKLGVVTDSQPYVDAVLEVVAAKERPEKSSKALAQAARRLERMNARVHEPLRHLLLGAIYLKQIMAQTLPPAEQVEKAHYHLMLAFDLGRERSRVRAAALTNLALLHQQAGNHGLANNFFRLRKRYPYIDERQQMQMAILGARSLFYVSAYGEAARELAEVSSLSPTVAAASDKSWSRFLRERWAFYLTYAGDYAQAITVYQELLGQPSALPPTVLAKVYLNYGRALFHHGEKAKAAEAWQQCVKMARLLGEKNADWAGMRGQRVLALAYGYLAQVVPLSQAKSYLDERGELLRTAGRQLSQWRLREGDWLDFMALNESHLAKIARQRGDPQQARMALQAALGYLQQSFAQGHDELSVGLYQTLVNLFVLMTESPTTFADFDWAATQKRLAEIFKSYQSVPGHPPRLEWREFKLRVHSTAARYRMGLADKGELKKLMEGEQSLELSSLMANDWQTLQKWVSRL